MQATTATVPTAPSVWPVDKENTETSRRSRWRPRRANRAHKEDTRLPRVGVESQVVTTAVQESMALDQALLAPSSVACRVQKDGFKILQEALLVSKLNQVRSLRMEVVHRFKYL